MQAEDVAPVSHQYTHARTKHTHTLDNMCKAKANDKSQTPDDDVPIQSCYVPKQADETSPSHVTGSSSSHVTDHMVQLELSASSLLEQFMYNCQTHLALQYNLDQHALFCQYASVTSASMQCDSYLMTKIQHFTQTNESLIQKLLVKVLKKSDVDLLYGLNLALSLPYKTAKQVLLDIIKCAGKHFKRIMRTALVGHRLSEINSDTQGMAEFSKHRAKAHWGYKLAKVKIESDLSDHSALLCQLANNPQASTALVLDFCSDFDVADKTGLLTYIKQLLLTSCGSSDLEEIKAFHMKQIKRAEEVICHISDVQQFYLYLEQLVDQLNQYDYERIRFVLKTMYNLNPNVAGTKLHLQLLGHLMNYTRVSSASNYEMSKVINCEEEQLLYGNNMPPLAKERMPYHLIVQRDLWKIMTPELTVDTAHTWTLITKLFKISTDDVYMTAIRNSVEAYIADSKQRVSSALAKVTPAHKNASGGAVGPGGGGPSGPACGVSSGSGLNVLWPPGNVVDKPFFDKVSTLLNCLEEISMAVMTVNWMIKELPFGGEKVYCLGVGVTLAKKWLESLGNSSNSEDRIKAEASYSSFLKVYKRLCTEQILYTHHMTDVDVTSLIRVPAKLIFKLYEHHSIQARATAGSAVSAFPDIHNIAAEIAGVNDLNIAKVKRFILEELLKIQNESSADMTLNTTMAQLESSEERTNDYEEVYQKLLYIIQQYESPKDMAYYLVEKSTKDSQSSGLSNVCKARALHCLFSLSDQQSLREMSLPVEQLVNHMLVLLYVSELDELCIPQTTHTFEKCSKQGLVKGIWSNHSHNPKAVRLIADLCLDYQIYDVQLWNSVLQQLLAFSKMTYLRHLLHSLSGIPQLWQVSGINNMWRTVVMETLSAVVAPLSEEQLEECLETFAIIHRCPLLLDLDIDLFITEFTQLDLLPCAIGCALLLHNTQNRESSLARLLNQSQRCVQALDLMHDWSKRGAVLPMAEQIESAVYSHIESQQFYDMIDEDGSLYKHAFLVHCVRHDTVHRYVLHLLHQELYDNALQLLSLYMKTKPQSDLSRAIKTSENLSHTYILQLFFDAYNVDASERERIIKALPVDEQEVELQQTIGANILYNPTGATDDSFVS